MIEFENQILIQRSLEDVFAFVLNLENIREWNYYVVEIRKTLPGPLGEGTTYHQLRNTGEQEFRVIEYRPAEKVVVKTLP